LALAFVPARTSVIDGRLERVRRRTGPGAPYVRRGASQYAKRESPIDVAGAIKKARFARAFNSIRRGFAYRTVTGGGSGGAMVGCVPGTAPVVRTPAAGTAPEPPDAGAAEAVAEDGAGPPGSTTTRVPTLT
jgi:hypothetical protein